VLSSKHATGTFFLQAANAKSKRDKNNIFLIWIFKAKVEKFKPT
jgi:hypothetical protein